MRRVRLGRQVAVKTTSQVIYSGRSPKKMSVVEAEQSCTVFSGLRNSFPLMDT